MYASESPLTTQANRPCWNIRPEKKTSPMWRLLLFRRKSASFLTLSDSLLLRNERSRCCSRVIILRHTERYEKKQVQKAAQDSVCGWWSADRSAPSQHTNTHSLCQIVRSVGRSVGRSAGLTLAQPHTTVSVFVSARALVVVDTVRSESKRSVYSEDLDWNES